MIISLVPSRLKRRHEGESGQGLITSLVRRLAAARRSETRCAPLRSADSLLPLVSLAPCPPGPAVLSPPPLLPSYPPTLPSYLPVSVCLPPVHPCSFSLPALCSLSLALLCHPRKARRCVVSTCRVDVSCRRRVDADVVLTSSNAAAVFLRATLDKCLVPAGQRAVQTPGHHRGRQRDRGRRRRDRRPR